MMTAKRSELKYVLLQVQRRQDQQGRLIQGDKKSDPTLKSGSQQRLLITWNNAPESMSIDDSKDAPVSYSYSTGYVVELLLASRARELLLDVPLASRVSTQVYFKSTGTL
jgi:hypothetical protein